MRTILRSSILPLGCVLFFTAARPASADDGPTMYKQLCASCHDTGAMESGPMLSMASAVSAIPGVVFSGAIDGHLRGYSTTSGSIIWDVDTVQTYEKTANGLPARGGSLNVGGPAISNGTVITNSGYVQNGMPGNVLLAYTVDGK